jgi:predicted O-methyltransferase YrrM
VTIVGTANPIDKAALLDLAAELDQLTADWHDAGMIAPGVLAAIIEHAPEGVEHTAETGSGRSTVLFSNLSPDHTVFSIDKKKSVSAPKAHPRLRADAVTWVIGPTQRTLIDYPFAGPLDIVLIDGPHGYPWPDMEYARLYPHLRPGSLLIVDDIHIPTIRHMFDFLAEDEMFRLLEVFRTTAIFARTEAPTLPPEADGWWVQKYNTSRFPLPLPGEPV